MKKSEKQKGKAAVANRRKQVTYAVAAAAVIIIVAAGFFLFGQQGARSGDTVMVYYTGMFENGTVFNSNLEGDPLIFTIGNGTMIPGFEEAVVGMTVNETKTVRIPVEKAYGPHLASRVVVVNRSNLSSDIVPEVGRMYTVTRSDGAVSRIRIINVTDTTVSIDENHLLTGQNLTFTIRFAGFYKK